MRKLLTLLILIIHIVAHSANVDSLNLKLKKEGDLKNRFKTIKEICSYYENINIDSALFYSDKLLNTARQIDEKDLIAESTYLLGVYYKKLRNFEKAFILYEKALNIWYELKDSACISKSFNALGVAYFENGNYKNAMEYLKKSYDIKKTLKDKKGIGITLYNIGNIYLNKANYDSALCNYFLSIKNFDEIDFKKGKASCLNSIGVIYEIMEDYDSALVNYKNALNIETSLNNYDGMINIYNNIGNIYSIAGKNKLALGFYQKALKYSELTNNNDNISNALKNIGLIYTFSSDFNEANSYLTSAARLAYDVGRKESIVNILHALGYSYTFQDKCDSAIYYLEKSLDIATEIDYVDMVSKNHNMLAQAYLCLGNGEKAFEHYQKQNKINEKISQQINNLKIQLISEQKEKQIEQLKLQNDLSNAEIKKQRIILLSISIIIILIIFIIFIIVRNQILKSKNKTSELKHRILQLQMNPHFIHNSLASIEGYLYVNEPYKTAEYISEFSHLMRNILENSRKDFIPLNKEIETITQYIVLQQFRYKDKFDYEIKVSDSIDIKNTLIPPMLSQPFVENSIEHGIVHLNKKGHIKIDFYIYKNNLRISIEDNGIGIIKSTELEQKHKLKHNPLAIKITNERLAIYSGRQKNKYRLIIEDIIINNNIEGTRIIINIPYKII